ncbi:major capsid protein [Arthrobacter phage Emotion]|uniref:Major capsid protein n=1 Tax=Arthrobacter phage Emotion TaxID=3038361 RepID=A0AA49IJX9_9CAUD|nr:major capsid protein [Arthrobacter phage Emotion]
MANDFFKPIEAAKVLANLASEDAFLSALVSRNFQDDLLGGGKGSAPVSIKIPTTLIARERDIDDITTNIVMDEIAEATETFNLDRKHDYSAVPLSEADMTLNIQDFSAQVLKPQAEAIVDSLEHKLATKLLGVPETELLTAGGAPIAYDPANPVAYFTQIRKALRKNGVAADGINMLVGTEVYANLLDANAITDASQSGSTAALREAGVGRVRGFNVVESTRVPDAEILAFHRDAVTLITRAPVVPGGASFGASVSEKGFSLRWLRDYLADKTVDRSLVSTFSAVGILPTYKIERDYATREVAVNKIENGGILHLDVSENV